MVDSQLTWQEVKQRIQLKFSPEDLADFESTIDRQLYLNCLTDILEIVEKFEMEKRDLEFLLSAVLATLHNVNSTRGSIALQTFLANLWEPSGVERHLEWMCKTIGEATEE